MSDRVRFIERKLAERYEKIIIDGMVCFLVPGNAIARVTFVKGFNAIIVEYAFSMNEARKNMFEDGDRFYVDEMDDEETLAAIIKEIEDV